MSYDIDIYVTHDDRYTSHFEVGNMTYNIRPMFRAAVGASFRDFHGMTCAQALPFVMFAWQQMKRRPDEFRKVEASNGWGTYDQFMPFLTKFYVMLRLHPTGIIRIS